MTSVPREASFALHGTVRGPNSPCAAPLNRPLGARSAALRAGCDKPVRPGWAFDCLTRFPILRYFTGRGAEFKPAKPPDSRQSFLLRTLTSYGVEQFDLELGGWFSKSGIRRDRQEVDPVQDQRQLRRRDLDLFGGFASRRIGQLIRAFFELLIPDAKARAAPI